MTMRVYALESTAHTGAEVITQFFSTSPALVTGAGDTPPDQTFIPAITQPGNYSINAFSGGKTYGKSQVGYGSVVLNNPLGLLDDMVGWGFDGRPQILRSFLGDPSGAVYPDDWETIYTGTAQQATMSLPDDLHSSINLSFRDRMAELHVRLPLAVYRGDNVLPDGLEGTVDDLKGKTKPLLLGKVFNMSLQCVNTSKLIYAVSPPTPGLLGVNDWDAIADLDVLTDIDGSVISGPVTTPLGTEYRRGGCSSTDIHIYDSGLELTKGADYATDFEMLNTAPVAGQYRVLPASGYIRCGSQPVGQLTGTAQDNNGHDPHTVGSIIRCILRDYMLWDVSRFNVTELAALDAACPTPVGILITQDTYVDDLLDTLCAAAGAAYYFDQLGVFRVFQVVDPVTLPSTQTLPPAQSVERVLTTGIPSRQIRLRYQKNWTVQNSGLAGGVTSARRGWLAQEYRECLSPSVTTAQKHLLSDELAFDTCFADLPQDECDRRLGLYSVRRDVLEYKFNIYDISPSSFQIGSVVTPQMGGRYGWSDKKALIIGIEPDLMLNKIALILWG